MDQSIWNGLTNEIIADSINFFNSVKFFFQKFCATLLLTS